MVKKYTGDSRFKGIQFIFCLWTVCLQDSKFPQLCEIGIDEESKEKTHCWKDTIGK